MEGAMKLHLMRQRWNQPDRAKRRIVGAAIEFEGTKLGGEQLTNRGFVFVSLLGAGIVFYDDVKEFVLTCSRLPMNKVARLVAAK
jgi:hypothetical protein